MSKIISNKKSFPIKAKVVNLLAKSLLDNVTIEESRNVLLQAGGFGYKWTKDFEKELGRPPVRDDSHVRAKVMGMTIKLMLHKLGVKDIKSFLNRARKCIP